MGDTVALSHGAPQFGVIWRRPWVGFLFTDLPLGSGMPWPLSSVAPFLFLGLCLWSDFHCDTQWSLQSFLTDFKAFCLSPVQLLLQSTIINNYMMIQKKVDQGTATSPPDVFTAGWTWDPIFFSMLKIISPCVCTWPQRVLGRVVPRHWLTGPGRKEDFLMRLLSWGYVSKPATGRALWPVEKVWLWGEA